MIHDATVDFEIADSGNGENRAPVAAGKGCGFAQLGGSD
ncbi:hypothetical protein BH20ACI3_BH20ACI3_34630 [soil metagenome]